MRVEGLDQGRAEEVDGVGRCAGAYEDYGAREVKSETERPGLASSMGLLEPDFPIS